MRIVFLIMLSVGLALASDVLVDNKTGLMWQDNSAAKYAMKDWQGAMTFCQSLQLAGHNDWRLPTVKELESVIDMSENNPAVKNSFKNVGDSGYYWSSTEDESDEASARMMNFKRAYDYINYKTYKRYIRCVRK